MPQMSPLSWMNLFITFIMTYMIFNSMNYFSTMYKFKTLKNKMSMKKMNWKW